MSNARLEFLRQSGSPRLSNAEALRTYTREASAFPADHKRRILTREQRCARRDRWVRIAFWLLAPPASWYAIWAGVQWLIP